MKLVRIALLVFAMAYCLASCAAPSTPEAAFWRWFQQNEAMLFDFERDQEGTFDQLASEMRKVQSSLTFEFGRKENGKREFVISADGIHEAFPKVESLFAAAPRMAKWTVIKFRPRRAPLDLEFRGILVKASSAAVVAERDGSRVALTVLLPEYTKASEQDYLAITYLLLDQALGEYDVEAKVGFVDVQAPSAVLAARAVPFSELPKVFDAMVSQ